MEIHHRSHSHEKKNWKAYLWDFLMLFLAVFCGFLAEYQLEHKIDRDREKIFIRSLVVDLSVDTSNFRHYINDGRVTMSLIDSLITMLDSPQNKKPASQIYHIARRITLTISPYEIFDRTYNQMKSSGNLRLLRSQDVADNITAYYSDITLLKSQQDFIYNLLLQYIRDVSFVLNPVEFHKMYVRTGLTVDDTADASTFKSILLPPIDNPSLVVPENKQAIRSLIGTLHYLYARILSTNSNIRNQGRAAQQLMGFLIDKYNFKQ